jgi:hypothetical protein
MILFPPVSPAEKLKSTNSKRLLIAAYGFEERSLGWSRHQVNNEEVISDAIIINYKNPKGDNKITELRESISKIGVSYPYEIDYDIFGTHNIEAVLEKKFQKIIDKYSEIIIDVTAMTKLLILVCLCKLENFEGVLRIVYTEAKNYAPSEILYNKSKKQMESLAKFPNRGFETILRAKCLSSIRMQGQPVVLVAFTSFNEQLIRHMLGTINPHLLLFINGRPPKVVFKWREFATQEIHSKLVEEFPFGNEVDENGLLKRFSSTLDYRETIEEIEKIYKQFGLYERIIIAATGSKLQTVGLFFSKVKHPDIHIEYPTPDSYFVQGLSTGIENVYEITIKNFKQFLVSYRTIEENKNSLTQLF